MNKTILAGMLLLVVSACTDKKTKMFQKIKALEESPEMIEDETMDKIAELKAEYGMEFKDSTANAYLLQAGMHFYYMGNKEESVDLLKEYLNRDDSSKNAVLCNYHLGYLAAEQSDFLAMESFFEAAQEISMPSKNQYSEMAKIYKSKIDAGNDQSIKDYDNLARCYSGLGMTAEAINILETGISTRAQDPKRAELIHKAAFLCWTEAQNPEKADTLYNIFLEDYPEHPLAADVQVILDDGLLYMTDEEQIEYIKNKKK